MIHSLCTPWLALALLAAREAEERVVPIELPAGPEALCPDVVTDERGGAWASWIEPAAEGAHALHLARFDAEAFGEPREIARGARWFVNWADFPALAARYEGGVLAAWLVRRGARATHYDVFVSLATDDAAPFGEGRRLHEDETEAEHGFVSLAALDEGRFGAVWLDGSQNVGGHGHGTAGAGATALRYAPVAADGAPGAAVVLDERVCDCCQTALVRRGSGELVVAYRDRADDEVRDVSFVRFRPDEPELASEPRAVHDDGWKIPGCPVNGPALAARGELVAASWFTLGEDMQARVQVAFLASDAEDFGAPRRVDEGAPEGRVDLAFVGRRLFASWMERAGDHAEWRVREVPLDPKAALPPSLLVAEVPLKRASGFLRMTAVGDELLALWTDAGVHAALVRP